MKPKVISDKLSTWKALKWDPSYIGTLLENIELRLGILDTQSELLWENQCKRLSIEGNYISTFLKETSDLKNQNTIPFFYYGYQDISQTFKDAMDKSFSWKDLGLSEDQAKDTTFWLGSQGSYTPCHYDTYGFNVIAQIFGQKLWIVFPPTDSPCLYPTRIPYEESSVFSQVNPLSPNLDKFPNFQNSHPHAVILSAGQAMYLPHHWWHYVVSLSEATISINTWVPMEVDKREHVNEATVRCITHSIMSQVDPDGRHWINSSKESITHEENLDFLNMACNLLDTEENIEKSEECFASKLPGTKNLLCFSDFAEYQNFLNHIKSTYFGFDGSKGCESSADEKLKRLYGPIFNERTDKSYLASAALVNSMATDSKILELTLANYKSIFVNKFYKW